MNCLVVGGSTGTAAIEGLSAAGATPDLRTHTPAADLEILVEGGPTGAPVVPVSPSGCPTPAVVSRAVVELTDLDPVGIDAGMASSPPTATSEVGTDPGRDIRRATALPGAEERFHRARALGESIDAERVMVGESIPGGTTTALAVLTALGERPAVSSSLAENPMVLKERVVAEALDASGLDPGDAAGDPILAVRTVGDPVLPAVAGLTVGALSTGVDVTLAGGTQLAAAAALVRHHGLEDPLRLATTAFVAADEGAAIEDHAEALSLDLVVTDPAFERGDHPALDAYVAGEAKEGVAMGGALAHADGRGVPMAAVRDRVTTLTDRLRASRPAGEP